MMSGEDNSCAHLVSADDNDHTSDTEQGTLDPASQQTSADSHAETDPVTEGSNQVSHSADQIKNTDDCGDKTENKSSDSGVGSSHDGSAQGQNSIKQDADSKKDGEAQENGQGDVPGKSTSSDVHSEVAHDRKQGISRKAVEDSSSETNDGELHQDRLEEETERLLPAGQINGTVAQHEDRKDASIHDDEAEIIDDEMEEDRIEALTSSILNIEGKAAAGTYFDSVPYTRHRGLKKYSTSLKTFLPVRTDTPKEVLPISHLGLLNFIIYGWATPIVWKMIKKGQSALDSYKLSEFDSAETNAHRLELLWNEALAKNGPDNVSLGKVIFKAFRTRLICTFIAIFFFIVFSLLNPIYLIRSLLEYLSRGETDIKKGVLLVIGMGLCELLRATSMSISWFISYQSGEPLDWRMGLIWEGYGKTMVKRYDAEKQG